MLKQSSVCPWPDVERDTAEVQPCKLHMGNGTRPLFRLELSHAPSTCTSSDWISLRNWQDKNHGICMSSNTEDMRDRHAANSTISWL